MINFKHRLHDTYLMPTRLRGRAHELNRGCHLHSLLSRFVSLSRDQTPGGSQPAFAGGDVARAFALNLYPLDYRTAFAFSTLPYPQSLGFALRLAFPRVRLLS